MLHGTMHKIGGFLLPAACLTASHSYAFGQTIRSREALGKKSSDVALRCREIEVNN
jgi:hypothetical protein